MDAEAFIQRWQNAEASERANSQSFLNELCELLGVGKPHPGNTNDYCFERVVKRVYPDGKPRADGRIDLYKKGCFVLESKQTVEKVRKSPAKLDEAMYEARAQAEDYAKHLDEWPPFLIVVDVGRAIELFADFSRSGKRYLPFKDASTNRISLAQLKDEKTRTLLHQVWTAPLSLDPSLHQQEVTQRVAVNLAEIARSLEKDGHPPEAVASFLLRCIFTMFAEDVRLIPEKSFTNKLKAWKEQPEKFAVGVQAMWNDMRTGTKASFAFDSSGARVLCFNGGLFAETDAFPLAKRELAHLLDAAEQDWKNVEPAIFGTLLERALNPVERHKLGAHFTPRAYVERLVFPTVVEPLRQDWDRVQQAVSKHLMKKDVTKAKAAAKKELLDFHHQLCATRVLDPACGTGNFLYVALEHMKRLEGEVLERLVQLEGTRRLELFGKDHETVDPHQFLGIEVNERAARIAEAVLWIGYLQWHFRNSVRQGEEWHEPVLKKFENIEHRDAVLAWDGDPELVRDETGKPVTRWDGVSMKKHPVTGEDVPDETKTVPLYRYKNARKAAWPQADFVVGNPPFIGNKRMRAALGDGYVDALRTVYAEAVPDSADYVMTWWHRGAEAVASGALRTSGFITTNSISQVQSGETVRRHLEGAKPISLRFAVPDHPWTDDGAQVRVAMTLIGPGASTGQLVLVDETGEPSSVATGRISSRLKLTAGRPSALSANEHLCWQGCKLVGEGFQIDETTRGRFLAEGADPLRLPAYWAGGDITKRWRPRFVVDLFGLSLDEARSQQPALVQHLLDRVKPERDQNRDAGFRTKWWLFGRPRPDLRRAAAALKRYIVTSEVAKHRVFRFLDWPTNLIDGSVIAVCSDDAATLGLLSSRPHTTWASHFGGRMGVGNDLRYQNGPCFDPYPFPVLAEPQHAGISKLATELTQHREKQQAAHPTLTITGVYNVLEKLRAGEALNAKDKVIYDQGLVGILKDIHDRLDAAVFDAYGWPKDLTDEQILEKLVALNHERAAEEKRGVVRWLRPDYQVPLLQGASGFEPEGQDDESDGDDDDDAAEEKKPEPKKEKKQAWPKGLPAQHAAIEDALIDQGSGTAESLAARFSSAKTPDVAEILDVLCHYGRAEKIDHECYVAVG